jgi:hypothetical protein
MRHSLSKTECFERCGQKYKYKYLEKIPEPKGMSASRGTLYHTNVELYLKGEGALHEDLEYYREFFETLKDMAARGQIKLEMERKYEIARDWGPCNGTEGDTLVAVIDLMFYWNPHVVLVYDWKTGKIYPEHKDQRELYSAIIMSADPTVDVVQFYHCYFDQHENRSQEIHREHLPKIKERWSKKMAEVADAHPLTLVPKPQFLCEWCGYRKAIGGPCKFG